MVVQAKDSLALQHLLIPLVEEVSLPPAELIRDARGVDVRWYAGWQPAEPLEKPAGKGTATVTGRVVDAGTGRPVAGALVWSGMPPELPPVRTGKDGTFRLPLPKAESSFGVAAAGYLLPGSPLLPSAKPVTVALKRAARIQGQVVDSEGTPVAGAALVLQPPPSRNRELSSLWYLSELPAGTDGGFSFPGVLAGGLYRLAASMPGYGRTEVEVRTAPDGRPAPTVRVVLGSGVIATGHVVDENGKPVEGAEVGLLGAEHFFPTGLLQAVSDATGAFSIRGVTPGQYQLDAVRKGFAPLVRAGILVPEGAARLDLGKITLKSGTAIEGRVIDAEGGPVEGAEIQAAADHEEISFLHLAQAPEPGPASDRDGYFLIPSLEPGRRYTVLVQHPDHPVETVSGIEAPTSEPITIELPPSRTLAGRVVGPEGEPVPNADVMAVAQTGLGSQSGSPLGRTDAAGEFRGGRLRPGTVDLQVSAGGYQEALWRGVRIPPDRDPEPITITLERGAVLEGRTVDQDGNPVADARVHARPRVQTEIRLGRLWSDHPPTGADGTFRLTGLAPGEYTVTAFAPRLGRSAEAAVRLASGTTRVNLVFERGVEVSGRVVNEEGQPIPAASVQLETAEGGGIDSVGAYTDADGSFVIPAVRDGEHQLTATAKGYGRSEPRRLLVSGSRVEGIEIRLSREAAGAIAGRILGLSAESLSRLRISANLESAWEDAEARPDEQGRFRLPDLRAGTWELRAFEPNGRTVNREAVVEPGTETFVELQFPEGLTFTGRLSLDGRPLGGADLVATSVESQGSFARARTDSEGRFSVGPLKPGLHSLIVFGAGNGATVYRTVRFEEDRELRLDIETGGIQGRILTPDGEPVPDAAVQLNAQDPATGFTRPDLGPAVRSDAQGSFELLSLPSGTYAVRVQKPGFEELQAQVEIRPGAPRMEEIVIQPWEP